MPVPQDPVHFLLIEDDDSHAELIRLSMEDNHIANTLDRVGDGAQALRYLRREPPFESASRPGVILLDLKLPRLDGHQVLEQIKSDETLRTIPVVVLTTSDAEADRHRAYSSHANSYLVKPVDFDKFHAMVRDLQLYWTAWNRAVDS